MIKGEEISPLSLTAIVCNLILMRFKQICLHDNYFFVNSMLQNIYNNHYFD